LDDDGFFAFVLAGEAAALFLSRRVLSGDCDLFRGGGLDSGAGGMADLPRHDSNKRRGEAPSGGQPCLSISGPRPNTECHFFCARA
jgi:hypothetical protein